MSKSTDKLAVLIDALKILPPEVFENIDTFTLTWKSVDGGDNEYLVCPEVRVTWKNVTTSTV